jgi:hypothetical protein
LVSKTELAIPLVIMFITLHVLQWISYTKIDVDMTMLLTQFAEQETYKCFFLGLRIWLEK